MQTRREPWRLPLAQMHFARGEARAGAKIVAICGALSASCSRMTSRVKFLCLFSGWVVAVTGGALQAQNAAPEPPVVVLPVPPDIPTTPIPISGNGRTTILLEEYSLVDFSRVTVRAGERVRVFAPDAGPGAIYRWTKHGESVSGSERILTFTRLNLTDGGLYHCIATRPDGTTVGSQHLELGVGPATRLLNFSTRGNVAPGSPLIGGFVVAGPQNGKRMIIRAVGPSLAGFGVTRPLARPKIAIYAGANPRPLPSGVTLTGGELESVGAFATTAGAADVTLGDYFTPGAYTVHVTSEDGGSGAVLLEIYEVP